MPIVDLAAFNSNRQFPSRHSVGRSSHLFVLSLSEGMRFDEAGEAAAKRAFEKIASQSDRIGLLEAMVCADSAHLFVCLRSTVSPLKAFLGLSTASEAELLRQIPSFKKPIWRKDCAVRSLGLLGKKELDAYRDKLRMEDGQARLGKE